MGSVWRNAQMGGTFYGTSDHGTGPGFGGAAVRAALPQPCRRDAGGHPDGGHPDARQAAAGGGAVGLGEYGGHRLPDAGSRGLPDRPGAQRLHGAGVSCPAAGGAAARRALCTGSSAPRRCCPAGAVRFIYPRRGPGAVPLPHMGTAAKGTALFRAGAAHPRGCPGRCRAAAGTGRVSGRVPGRAVRPGAAGGGCRTGISAGAAGTAAARPCRRGDSRLPPRPAGAGKQRRALPLPAGRRGRPVADGPFRQRCGGVLRHPQPPVPHRGHHARRTPGRTAALGSPRPGTAIHH